MRNKIVLMAMLVALGACSNHKKPESLYDQLGGAPVINQITSNLLDRILNNEKIAFLFKETVREDLHERIVSQLCQETGGPCVYEGLDMVEAHSGQEIKYSEFDVFVEDLILAMEDANVPFTLQNQFLAIFAPMREDITYQ